MNKADGSIETLFQEKLMCHHELVALLKQEQKQIVGADVDALWKMSDKKQALVEEIETIRARILKAADALNIDHGMTPWRFQISQLLSLLPAEQRRRIGGTASSLLALKKEIRDISLESKQYIESKLGMIDELISIMTGRERQRRGYGATSTENRNRCDTPMLFRREV